MKIKRLIRLGICFSVIILLISCIIPDYIEETTEGTEEALPPGDVQAVYTAEYINDTTIHIPENMCGTYEYNGQTWELTSVGIISPISYLLYPNPVTSASFLSGTYYSRDGETIEKVGDGCYYFFGKAVFEYNGRVYEGSCKLEIIK